MIYKNLRIVYGNLFFKISYIYFTCVCVCVYLSTYVSAYYEHDLPLEAISRDQILWKGSYRPLLATIRVLAIKPQSSGRAASSLNH